MDSEQKCDVIHNVIIVVLFLGFLLGPLELSKVLDPYTLQTATFRYEERMVAVYTNRQAIEIGGSLISNIEVFEEKGKIMTQARFSIPRRGIFITTRPASIDEIKLFHEFF